MTWQFKKTETELKAIISVFCTWGTCCFVEASFQSHLNMHWVTGFNGFYSESWSGPAVPQALAIISDLLELTPWPKPLNFSSAGVGEG